MPHHPKPPLLCASGRATGGAALSTHTHDIGAEFDFLVDAFQRIRRPNLSPVKPRESAAFKRATLGIGQHFGDLRVGTSEIGGDPTKLLLDGSAVALGENGA